MSSFHLNKGKRRPKTSLSINNLQNKNIMPNRINRAPSPISFLLPDRRSGTFLEGQNKMSKLLEGNIKNNCDVKSTKYQNNHFMSGVTQNNYFSEMNPSNKLPPRENINCNGNTQGIPKRLIDLEGCYQSPSVFLQDLGSKGKSTNYNSQGLPTGAIYPHNLRARRKSIPKLRIKSITNNEDSKEEYKPIHIKGNKSEIMFSNSKKGIGEIITLRPFSTNKVTKKRAERIEDGDVSSNMNLLNLMIDKEKEREKEKEEIKQIHIQIPNKENTLDSEDSGMNTEMHTFHAKNTNQNSARSKILKDYEVISSNLPCYNIKSNLQKQKAVRKRFENFIFFNKNGKPTTQSSSTSHKSVLELVPTSKPLIPSAKVRKSPCTSKSCILRESSISDYQECEYERSGVKVPRLNISEISVIPGINRPRRVQQITSVVNLSALKADLPEQLDLSIFESINIPKSSDHVSLEKGDKQNANIHPRFLYNPKFFSLLQAESSQNTQHTSPTNQLTQLPHPKGPTSIKCIQSIQSIKSIKSTKSSPSQDKSIPLGMPAVVPFGPEPIPSVAQNINSTIQTTQSLETGSNINNHKHGKSLLEIANDSEKYISESIPTTTFGKSEEEGGSNSYIHNKKKKEQSIVKIYTQQKHYIQGSSPLVRHNINMNVNTNKPKPSKLTGLLDCASGQNKQHSVSNISKVDIAPFENIYNYEMEHIHHNINNPKFSKAYDSHDGGGGGVSPLIRDKIKRKSQMQMKLMEFAQGNYYRKVENYYSGAYVPRAIMKEIKGNKSPTGETPGRTVKKIPWSSVPVANNWKFRKLTSKEKSLIV